MMFAERLRFVPY